MIIGRIGICSFGMSLSLVILAMLKGYTGGMRKGKTLLMVRDQYLRWTHGRKVTSNLTLSFPQPEKTIRNEHLLPFEQPTKFKLIDLVRFMDDDTAWRNIDLSWDEIYVNLEARLSGSSQLNMIASYFIFQSGKRDVDIRWTSQKFGSPDNRLRWSTVEIGTLVKALGVFVYCYKKSKVIDATICWKSECVDFEGCKETQNFYLRYAYWNGSTIRQYRLNRVQRLFDFYKTEELISFEETVEVQAFLQARTRELKSRYRKAFRSMFKEEKPEDFIKKIKRELL